MSRFAKAAILGLLTGTVGLGIGLTPFGLDLEENAGLGLFFRLRGVQDPPSDVLIVSVDQSSAEPLGLPDDVRKWPRSVHAQLIENLAREGAAVLAFDILFDEAKSPKEDELLADAIQKAGNVVLCECIRSEKIILADRRGAGSGHLDIERLVPPIPPLAQAAIGLAPFPLPKVPVRIGQYWTFRTSTGDVPTLPVVAFHVFALQVYDEFIELLKKTGAPQIMKLPRDREEALKTKNVEKVIQDIREILESEPQVAERMLEDVKGLKTLAPDGRKIRILRALITMYKKGESQYLYFYGPPGTVRTIPYHQALQPAKRNNRGQGVDFKNKAVFVGLSERFRPEQRDGFYTVFSESSGIDLSGVEIAATAFANLLEDRPVQPVRFYSYVAILFLWGLGIGFFCRLFPTFFGALGVLALGAIYLVTTAYQFKTTGTWYPLVFPLLIQIPFAFTGAFVWKYVDTNRERQNIRRAFEHYLPNKVVDQLARNVLDFKGASQMVYGICLHTDVERYTSLSEAMAPQELGSFMNRYFETVFRPIKDNGGVVSNIAGDSVLALWVKEKPDFSLRTQACRAALDITTAIHQFNQSSESLKLPTRIGLHSGNILLGNVGAYDHYEYHPVGDIVNTASRIESLNKQLGTRMLMSEEVVSQLDGFLTRDLGRFVLAGKTKPLGIHELICRSEESDGKQRELCALFPEILEVFRRQAWKEAEEKLREAVHQFGEDGPSRFYLELCEQYQTMPLEEPWDGVIEIKQK